MIWRTPHLLQLVSIGAVSGGIENSGSERHPIMHGHTDRNMREKIHETETVKRLFEGF